MLTVAILAGGQATRLRPMTETIPKSLLELNGEPFAIHQLRLLKSNGISRVVICVGHLGALIQRALGTGTALGVEVDYAFDGPVLLGTAGAIKNALPKLGDAFFVIYGDSYLPCDYARIAHAFAASGAMAMMTVFRNEGKWDTSNVEFEDGKILAYSKTERTPRMRYIDYGLGVFRAAAFEHVPAGKPYDLADLYADLLGHRQLTAYEMKERFYEIGSPAGLRETAEFLATGKTPKLR